MLNLKIGGFSAVLVLGLAMGSSLPAATIFITTLNGANEVPPTGSAAVGSATVTLSGNILTINEVFSGLTMPASAAHIHCCGPLGVNEQVAVPFTGFPSMLSGTYMQSIDLSLASSYTAAFVTFAGGTAALAESTLIAALNAGQTYANIHNATFPGGEIRGQLLAAVPEPASFGLLLLGLIPVVAKLRKK